jgi:hypothetical protein
MRREQLLELVGRRMRGKNKRHWLRGCINLLGKFCLNFIFDEQKSIIFHGSKSVLFAEPLYFFRACCVRNQDGFVSKSVLLLAA